MRGTFLIIAGLLLIAAGAIGLYNAYEGANTGYAAVSLGAIIVGVLALLGGIGSRVGNFMTPPSSTKREQGYTEIRALIQSMGVVAVADGKIRQREIAAITDIHEQVLGLQISESEVREILSEFGEDFDITKRLERDRGHISPAMKRMILESCQRVMVSDLEVPPSEVSKVHEIGEALGFAKKDIDAIIAAVST